MYVVRLQDGAVADLRAVCVKNLLTQLVPQHSALLLVLDPVLEMNPAHTHTSDLTHTHRCLTHTGVTHTTHQITALKHSIPASRRYPTAQCTHTHLLNSSSLSRSSRAECVVILETLNSRTNSSRRRPIRLSAEKKRTEMNNIKK